MATGALDANGIWQYGEDDSEPTFSALLNKLGNSVSTSFDKLKVLQVVTGKSTARVTVTSSTAVTIGLGATITPSRTTSKILVTIYVPIIAVNASTQIPVIDIGIYKANGTVLLSKTVNNPYGESVTYLGGLHALTYVDSPNTTSATQYGVYVSVGSNTTGYFNSNASISHVPSYITLTELR